MDVRVWKHRMVWNVLIGLTGCMFGLAVSQVPVLWAGAVTSDVEWAQEQGILRIGIDVNEAVKQAEFVRMLMRAYGVGEPIPNAKPPKGAENHWAAGYYATAKAKGVIDCTCQIKPESSITNKEGAKFVLLAINSKANQQLLSLEEVLEWVKGEPEGTLTHAGAAKLLRKMHHFMTQQKLIEEEV